MASSMAAHELAALAAEGVALAVLGRSSAWAGSSALWLQGGYADDERVIDEVQRGGLDGFGVELAGEDAGGGPAVGGGLDWRTAASIQSMLMAVSCETLRRAGGGAYWVRRGALAGGRFQSNSAGTTARMYQTSGSLF